MQVREEKKVNCGNGFGQMAMKKINLNTENVKKKE